eukprot:4144218-Amphidinium_carterae.1
MSHSHEVGEEHGNSSNIDLRRKNENTYGSSVPKLVLHLKASHFAMTFANCLEQASWMPAARFAAFPNQQKPP